MVPPAKATRPEREALYKSRVGFRSQAAEAK